MDRNQTTWHHNRNTAIFIFTTVRTSERIFITWSQCILRLSASWYSVMLAITFIMRSSDSSRVSTYKNQLTPNTDSHASYSGAVWRKWRRILGAKFKLLYSETALSRKQFVIGHMYVYTFFCLEWPILSTKNIDISFWDTLYMQLVG